MRVGILSMQQIGNYGSFLQAYALKSQIESFGHSCSFIKIEEGKQIPELNRNIRFYLNKLIERFFAFDFAKRIYSEYIFRKTFKKFHKELGVYDETLSQYDVVVIGSDEVFNCIQSSWWGFTTQLFGDIAYANRIITYAGSFGHTTISDIEKYGVKREICNSMRKISSVSVRDDNSAGIVNELLSISPIVNVDPVIMYDFDNVIPDHVKDENYIIIYTYPGRISSKKEIEAIKQFAKLKNKKLISIGFYFSWCDKTIVPHPFEVMAYIKNADYIITDTFHGSVMSFKFNKKFCTIVRDSNKQKLTSLLQQFDLTNRIVSEIENIPDILTSSIDYESVNAHIKQEKEKSKKYLKENII